MKTLLVAINASYSHTNLAVRSLKYYALNHYSAPDFSIDFCEFTINQPVGEILRGIAFSEADLVLFSTYIWNAELVCKIIPDIKKLLPNARIGAGGPEFGYWPEGYMKKLPDLDFVAVGEGEVTTLELIKQFPNTKMPGVYYRDGGEICFGGIREPLCDLSELPFCYPDLSDPDNRLYYYESNRGCPFSCSYCMSSLDRKVRYMPLERVFADLQRFMDGGVRIVKFVDRTFNLDEERYLAIWDYILSHHNGKTMFHFEIEAEYLSQKALEFLQKVPPHVMQFEIGVQSSNAETLKAISRSPNVETLAENVRQIPRTIHQHLDLIAGLPYEDLETFGKSFDFVMALRPDALQLGFLKVLHGTKMEEYAKANGWKWMDNPAYETFSTPYMSYADMNYLKDIETAVDAYYNSETFGTLMDYVLGVVSPWEFFCAVVDAGRSQHVFDNLHKEGFWFEFFAKLLKEPAITKEILAFEKLDKEIMYELLRYDFVRHGKKGNFPEWYVHKYNKEAHRAMLMENGGIKNARLDFANSEYEEFRLDPKAKTFELLPENKVLPVLIFYKSKVYR